MSEDYRAETAATPAPYQGEIEHTVDERIITLQETRVARRRRAEYLKFGILAAILLITVLVIALARPLIFGRIVPAVMGGDSAGAVMDEGQPAQETQPASDTAMPEDNTQNLPIISVPGTEEGTGEGIGGQAEEATAVPAQIYVVQAGDTLNSIARQFNTTVEAIVTTNDIQNPDALLAGTTLTIPQP